MDGASVFRMHTHLFPSECGRVRLVPNLIFEILPSTDAPTQQTDASWMTHKHSHINGE